MECDFRGRWYAKKNPFSEALLTFFIVRHNIAYGIDFSGGSVEFYRSTGSDPLALTVAAVSVSASSVRMEISELVPNTY